MELLPRAIEAVEDDRNVAQLCVPDSGTGDAGAGGDDSMSSLVLRGSHSAVSLNSLIALAEMPDGQMTHPVEADDELACRNLPWALGKLLAGVIDRQGADQRTLYRMGLVLAMLTRSREAYATLCLIDVPSMAHPALFALRGYLALQNGEVETGRRFLAKAALASRGSASSRSILHFTQHVLLLHQFNG